MFISEAFAQTAGPDPTQGLIGTMAPLVLMLVVFYFLLIRPQQQQRKKLMESIAALKKNDMVVTSGGLVGKVKSLADDEIRLELGPNVEVRVMRYAIAEVRSKTDPAPANDSKPASE
ncbi:MAG: preprotein translocase subunit YajC [Alphaproteobacteria bacterium]|nr:preprotein translocase subunit YajC [Alphaproteobacteria bacterium]